LVDELFPLDEAFHVVFEEALSVGRLSDGNVSMVTAVVVG
jgi:hypothetical protein